MKLKFSQITLIVFAAVLAVSIYFAGTNPISRAIRDSSRINILLMGMDAVAASKHTDVLILASYSPSEQIVDMVSIPRDTLVKFDGGRLRRINEIFAFYYKKNNSRQYAAQQLLRHVNNELLEGFIDVKYYVQVEYEIFVKLVDMLGKVKVEITEPMKYDDFAEKLHIDFSPGIHYLNGADALKYVRFRGKGSDIRRINRQQKFIIDWIKSIKKPALIAAFPRILTQINKYFDSNISVWGWANLFLELRDVELARVRFLTLPGRFYGAYWMCDKAAMSHLFEKFSSDKRDLAPYILEVWNASGNKGAAKSARDILIKAGFNVEQWGNYSVMQEKTTIKNMTGDVNAAALIQSALDTGEIINKFESGRNVDMVVIVGRDFKADTRR